MGTLLSAFVLIAAAAIQATAIPYYTGGAAQVNLVLLLVLAWGIIRGVQEGLLWGLIGGLILGAVSVAPSGTTLVVLGIVGLLGGWQGFLFARSNVFGPSLAALIGTFLYNGLLMGLLALLGRDWRWLDVFREVVVPAAFLNAVFMIPIYWLLFHINRRMEPAGKW